MDSEPAKSGFVGGLVSGILAGLLTAAFVLIAADSFLVDDVVAGWTIDESLSWAYRNLGLSLPVFAIILALYFRSIAQLRRSIDDELPVDRVAHADHLSDTWTSLFFGVGVIWTAIGMRGALLYSLGDPESSVNLGAFAVLQRMVNGGILVALSTTIFGGVGGYLMRVVKTVLVGASLRRYYDRETQRPGDEIKATLATIERHLASLTRKEPDNESPSMEPTSFPRRV